MSELAIKPTRRETLRLVIAAVEKKKHAEAAAANARAEAIRQEHNKAKNAQTDAARAYGDHRYKPLLQKIIRAIKPDFPGVTAHVYTEFEKERDPHTGQERIKPGGTVSVRLYVGGTDKAGEALPKGTLDAVAAAKAKADQLAEQYTKARREAEEIAQRARDYSASPHDYKYAKLLEELIPTLGEDAAVHLDALAALVEGAVKGKAKS